MRSPIRTDCALLLVLTALCVSRLAADEPAPKLEPIPLPQATAAPASVPEPIPAPLVPPQVAPSVDAARVVEVPPVVTFPAPPPAPPASPPVVIHEQPLAVPAPRPVVVVPPAPPVQTTHFYYRPFRRDFVPVSVATVPTRVRVVSPLPPPELVLGGPVAVAPVVVEEQVVVVPRHVPGQPLRNAVRRRWLP